MQTIRLYADVARYRSFSEAAREHGITQSAASQRIRSLEDRLGVMLIDRSVRPLALTPAGEVYGRGCIELLER
jgi:DNA-binding transcriptional LysR family regulator